MSEEILAAQTNNEAATEVKDTANTVVENQATETKGAETAKTETPKADESIVENYDLKFAEGIPINAELTKSFVELAKAEGIKPATAQKLADFQVGLVQKAQEAQEAQFAAWATETEAALGANKSEVLTRAGSALAKFDPTGQLAKDLQATGLGNKKEWIELFASLGTASKEGSLVESNPAKGGGFLDKMYPSMTK